MMTFNGVGKPDRRQGQAASGNAETNFGDWVAFLRSAIQRAGVDPDRLKDMDWQSLQSEIGQKTGAFNPGAYAGSDLRANSNVINMLAQSAGGRPQDFLALPPERQREEFGVPGYAGVN